MTDPLSSQIARQLRDDGPFHLPPAAQPLNSTVRLTLEDADQQPTLHLTDTRRDYTWKVLMDASDDVNTWYADVLLPMEPTIVTYTFTVDDSTIHERRQVEGQNTPIYGEWTELPFKIAVYNPARMPAEWIKGMVVYQVFPDRFAKAQSDDKAKAAMKGVYGHEPVFKQWGDRPESPPLGRDFYGGDLQGLISKLDYLSELGVECIYLNPIFEAASNHRYEAIDFMTIDEMLGTEADFDELIQEAHARGLRIVLDAVFNHCSSDSIYFDITGKYSAKTGIPGAYQSQQSPYYRWFKFRDWPQDYDGWIGLGFMPEFVECPEMEAYFVGPEGVTAHWLNKGIDGWRCDVAFDNTTAFWQRFRTCVDKTKPDAWLISEDWRDSTHYMLGDTFNGTMNYRFQWAVRGYLGTDDLLPSQLDDRLQTWMRDTPGPAIHAQMNLLDSHDTDRAFTACGGDRDRYKQMIAFQMAYPGAPTVYYGNETGIEGDFAEDGRRCFPWDDIDDDLHEFFTHVMTLRRDLSVLRTGDTETVIVDDQNRIYGFRRYNDNRSVYALFNATAEEKTVSFTVDHEGTLHDLLKGYPDVTVDHGEVEITLQPRGIAWYSTQV